MYKSETICASILIVWIGMSWGCASAPPCPPAETIKSPDSQPTSQAGQTNSALEHKVKAQERRIAELSMQLRMLKRIDLDGKKDR
jgi:hypothetical protein